jgi:hypothetical protein
VGEAAAAAGGSAEGREAEKQAADQPGGHFVSNHPVSVYIFVFPSVSERDFGETAAAAGRIGEGLEAEKSHKRLKKGGRRFIQTNPFQIAGPSADGHLVSGETNISISSFAQSLDSCQRQPICEWNVSRAVALIS